MLSRNPRPHLRATINTSNARSGQRDHVHLYRALLRVCRANFRALVVPSPIRRLRVLLRLPNNVGSHVCPDICCELVCNCRDHRLTIALSDVGFDAAAEIRKEPGRVARVHRSERLLPLLVLANDARIAKHGENLAIGLILQRLGMTDFSSLRVCHRDTTD